MADKSKPLMVRLPQEHLHSFDRLAMEFSGLPPATVLRMMAVSFLQQPLEVQIQKVEEQIRPAKKNRVREHRNHARSG
jgi:hypothetical protein